MWRRIVLFPHKIIKFGVLTCAAAATLHELLLFHHDNDKVYCDNRNNKFNKTYNKLIKRELDYFKTVNNIPGMSCIVSVDGEIVFSYGSGYSDVETLAKCFDYSLFRIASISKILTTIVLAKLVEENKLNFSDKLSKYLDGLPYEKAEISVENLASNTSGIRHYNSIDEMNENFNNYHFTELDLSFDLFIHDQLVHQPQRAFTYSTHGFTLLGGVIEKVTGVKFEKLISELSRKLGLVNTSVDHVTRLNFQKSNGYYMSKDGKIEKYQYMDNSWKYPGGGCLSNSYDLVRIGNMLLSSYQNCKNSYLSQDTINKLWTPTEQSLNYFKDKSGYGLGFRIGRIEENHVLSKYTDFMVFHAGAGEGSSGILLITPPHPTNNTSSSSRDPTKEISSSDIAVVVDDYPLSLNLPKGIVVVILCNLQGIKFQKLANTIVLHTYNNSHHINSHINC